MRGPSLRSLAGVAFLCVVATAHARQAPSSVRAGVYTREQAARGEKLYTAKCARCHGDALGGIEQAPPLTGPEFTTRWEGALLSDLVKQIKSMPPDEDNGLSRPQLVEILTYVLSVGGLPAGSSLLSDETSVLSKIKFEGVPPASAQGE